MHSWTDVVCFLGSRRKNSSSLSSFLPSFERRRETEKRRRNLDLRHHSRWLRYLFARVVRPRRSVGSGEIPFCRYSDIEFPLSTIKTTGPENKVNSSSPPPSSPPPPRFSSTRAEEDHDHDHDHGHDDHEPCQCIAGLSINCNTAITTTKAALDYLEENSVCKPRRTRPSVRATITSCKRTTITALTIRSHMMSSRASRFEAYYEDCHVKRQFGRIVKLPSSRLFRCEYRQNIVAEMEVIIVIRLLEQQVNKVSEDAHVPRHVREDRLPTDWRKACTITRKNAKSSCNTHRRRLRSIPPCVRRHRASWRRHQVHTRSRWVCGLLM